MYKRLAKKVQFYFSVSALYALALFFVLSSFGVNLFRNSAPSALAQAPAPISTPEKKVISAKPTRIVIPSVEVNLPVTDGEYNPSNQKWTLSDNHAHYAISSMIPNDNGGNTLIYGHKYDWVFGGLKGLKPGDQMQLIGNNGHVFTYIYENTQPLKPDDNSVFRYNGAPTVSVQTCSGRWNEIRQMYNFRLAGVS